MDMIVLKDVHEEDRPRERLLQQGAQSLSNAELLAILLRTGTRELSAVGLANHIMQQVEQLHALKHITLEELTAIKGIGTVKAVQLLAAIELGRRLARKQDIERYTIRSPGDAAAYLMADMTSLLQEHFVALFLNVKNQILYQKTIFIGSLNSSIVHPRELFREAVKRSAASIIVCHNHPSGNPQPSPEDIEVTQRLQEAGLIIGIELVDHIIIGNHNYVSLKEKGYLT
ncbi:hypothetical protein BN1050_00307 [Metalysinibacillus saudimassiliensis]|uniref:MPN domain-containing protein n=1 Tax=Metalysinibacillus saudimassiliensis TaxID=1461583 RepID=A0A078M571_9BACL|nr:hypothetical protein BN1050_00307 [Metalysinibacillus saudimassiliensis]